MHTSNTELSRQRCVERHCGWREWSLAIEQAVRIDMRSSGGRVGKEVVVNELRMM